MKTTFSVALVTPQNGVDSLWLEVDLPFAPSMDMEFAHPVWGEHGRKPLSISFNLERLSFYVCFENEEFPDGNAQKERRDIYTSEGWKLPYKSH